MEKFDENKKKYFIIAIALLIVLGVFLIIHFNNRSMESGEKEKKKKNTTEKITTTEVITTKKKESNDIAIAEEAKDIYKSVIDKDNKLVYNYKLTDEIADEDNIISKVMDISDTLKEKSIIKLYDISLFDSNGVKKTVKNSLINISIPITGDLVGYDEYKVVYIVDNEIQDEEFKTTVENNYINFSTTHLSLFGIIGTKNTQEETKTDLSNVKVSLTQNDDEVSKYASTDDKIGVSVTNADEINYNIYYALKNNETTSSYALYSNGLIFNNVDVPGEYTVLIKIVEKDNESNYKVFELDKFKVFDIVYKNTGESVETTIGTIMLDEETESDYKDEEANNNIVIDEVEDTVSDEDKVVVNVKGNIYLVEETDISKLEMTGYLYIDTDEKITGNETINITNLEKITITSEVFNYNGVKYTYSKDTNGNVVINKYVEVTDVDTGETTEEISDEDITDDFEELFESDNPYEYIDMTIDDETNALVITKDEYLVA